MFKVYKAIQTPLNLSGAVGGIISTNTLSGYVGELFQYVSAPPEGSSGSYQYRKVFIKNEYLSTSSNTRIWLDSIEHSGQIHMATGTSTDYITNSLTEPVSVSSNPEGWINPNNYANGLSVGTLSPGQTVPLWLRQTLSGISEPDPYVSFRIQIGGIIP